MMHILENASGKDELTVVQAVGTILRWPVKSTVVKQRDSMSDQFYTVLTIGPFVAHAIDPDEKVIYLVVFLT